MITGIRWFHERDGVLTGLNKKPLELFLLTSARVIGFPSPSPVL